MSVTEKTLSKDFVLNVNTGTPTHPVWTKLHSRKDLTLAISEETVDLKDCDAPGSDLYILSRAFSFTVTANRLEDSDTGARDPAQAAMEAMNLETGWDARLDYQIVTPGGEEWLFSASTTVTPFGGDQSTGANWSATLSAIGTPDIKSTGSWS